MFLKIYAYGYNIDIMEEFKGNYGAMKVATFAQMRKSENEFKDSPIDPNFSALYETDSTFTASRFISRLGVSISPDQLPPHPAGLPTRRELLDANVKFPANYELLPQPPLRGVATKTRVHRQQGDFLSVGKSSDFVLSAEADLNEFSDQWRSRAKDRHQPFPIAVLLEDIKEELSSPIMKLRKRRIVSF